MLRFASAAVLAAISLPAIGAATAESDGPMPFRGVPLGKGSGLRLVVADTRPFVLDVDSGRFTPIPDIPALGRGVRVVGVGGRAAVVWASSPGTDANLYGVRGPGARVSRLGIGQEVRTAGHGRAAWVFGSRGRVRCTLRQVGLDGRAIRGPRAFPCATTTDPSGGSLGLVVRRTRVLDPLSGRSVFQAPWGIVAVAGTSAVLAGPGRAFTLIDARTRAERRFPWPSTLAWHDRPAADPQGRYIALGFANPAWHGYQGQDVWVLDTATGKLTQLPGMPEALSLKATSMAWTDDGRLVLLGERFDTAFAAVWRPGWRRLAVKRVSLPERQGGSDSFAPIR